MDKPSRQQLRAGYRAAVKRQATLLIPRGKSRDCGLLTQTGRRREVVERIRGAIEKADP